MSMNRHSSTSQGGTEKKNRWLCVQVLY